MRRCNILTLHHRNGRISEVASRTGTPFPKSSAWRSFFKCSTLQLAVASQTCKARAGGRAGAQLLSPRILTDLKYSNLSPFDAATRIFIHRGFLQNFNKMDSNMEKERFTGRNTELSMRTRAQEYHKNSSQHHRFCRCCLRKFSLRNLVYIETGVINSQRLSLQVTIADVNYYSALRTPADFKTILHVKFPTSKSRQIGSRLLERVK